MSKTHKAHGNKGFIEDQRQFFDQLITQDWDTYINPLWDQTRQIEVQEILKLVPAPKRVLDVGCGCGYHDLIFAESTTVEHVLGIDYSSKSIEQAQHHYPHLKVKRCMADIFEHEKFINQFGRFDLVTSFQVIEHLKNGQTFLEACANCAASKGYIAVVTPNRDRLKNRIGKLLGRKPTLIDPLHFVEYSIKDLLELGRQVGLNYIGCFGHSIDLSFKGIHLLKTSSLAIELGRLIPSSWSQVIGVVFQRS